MTTIPSMHTGDPAYAPPVLRASSPAQSLSTEYGPDETSLSDSELTDEQFARQCEEQIGLQALRDEEHEANHDVLLPRPKEGSPEEKILHGHVMRSLRGHVTALEQEELFESAMLKGSQAAFEDQPSSHDIDVLMQSMMGPPTKNAGYRRKSPGFMGNGGSKANLELYGRKGKGSARS